MSELIEELKSLIIYPRKGSSGETGLRSTPRITVYKILKIINKLEQGVKQ